MTASIWDDPQMVERAKALWLNGASAGQIAKTLGMGLTRSAVIGKLYRMGIRRMDPLTNKDSNALGNRLRAGVIRKPKPPKKPKAPPVAVSPSRARDLAKPVEAKVTGKVEGSEPRHYLTRSRLTECSWIVEGEGHDSLACCLPISKGSFCEAHARAAYAPQSPRFYAPRLKTEKVRL